MDRLYVTEIFASIQGETSTTGLPTTFIRLSGCNLRCTWCDTTYSFQRGQAYSEKEVLHQVEESGLLQVTITGGEPLLQKPVFPLMTRLADRGYRVSIETSGSLSTEGIDPRVKVILDIKCPASKMAKHNDYTNLDRLRPQDEVKFVVQDEEDYEFAKTIMEKHAVEEKGCERLFSPVHGVLDPKRLVAWILRDKLPVRLNLQIHKVIWDPKERGV